MWIVFFLAVIVYVPLQFLPAQMPLHPNISIVSVVKFCHCSHLDIGIHHLLNNVINENQMGLMKRKPKHFLATSEKKMNQPNVRSCENNSKSQ